MTRFAAGDRVVSNVDAQGLRTGQQYTVREVHPHVYAWGTFVVYEVTDGVRTYGVANGHLLLDRVL